MNIHFPSTAEGVWTIDLLFGTDCLAEVLAKPDQNKMH